MYITNVQNFENYDYTLDILITTTQTESAGILLKSDGDGVWEEGEFHLYTQDGYITFVGFDNEYIKSTIQINDPKKGLSFKNKSKLNMKMGINDFSAHEVIHNLGFDEINKIIK